VRLNVQQGDGVMAAKKDLLWVSNVPATHSIMVKFSIRIISKYGKRERLPTEEQKAHRKRPDIKRISEGMTKHSQCERLADDEVLTKAYGVYYDTDSRPPKHLFKVNNQVCVDRAFRDVLEEFDLGGTTFHPFELYQADQVRKVDGEYYALNWGCFKEALIPELTDVGLRVVNAETNPGIYTERFYGKENDMIAVRATTLEGCDLFVDPKFWGACFFSDRLIRRLKEAKMSRRIERYRCKIVYDN